ncbi:MAG: class I SAM-dependent methyltransferase [Candidatus Bathyarchaeota archaeon]|nr:class I SAM-dependent methyltransferase [Candidatus Bathyarchaeota archaeon]
MASYVFMKILESAPQRYDMGINLISFGQGRRMQQEIVEEYVHKSNKVLEIGCGTGTLAISCAKKGASVVAFDKSSQMLAIAERKVREHNLIEKIQLEEMGAIEMEKAFNDNTFDRIVSTLVFSELYADEQKYVLSQAYRILRPNGLIIIADEVKPRSSWKRIVHSSIRIPLALITYLLTQTSTKALEDIKGPMTNAGFKIIREQRSFIDSFALFVGQKE